MKAKPYILTVLFLISCGIFCISCFQVAGASYLSRWEAVMSASALAWGYLMHVLYDYARGVK